MHSATRRGRWGTVSATGVLIALTAFGVLLMHSVTPTAPMSMSTSMSGGRAAAMTSTATDGSSAPVAFGEHHCPSAHQMMHPCVGTTVSWTALTAPAVSGEIDLAPISADRLGRKVDSTLERAPPWTLWELDRSVTLRV
ncbi:DUF6153 family protein [Rhodococcus sp. AW25M09]|uniref:DUF6153 family protein n=1 Tax=Rhodococcus sp. AW25M09 TaxID=1268303 RepID=UPI0005B3A9D7|nr:DUF6153 family protein [Rhodococcus sp. AW25M09]